MSYDEYQEFMKSEEGYTAKFPDDKVRSHCSSLAYPYYTVWMFDIGWLKRFVARKGL